MTIKYTQRLLLFATALFCSTAAVFATPANTADETVDRTPVDPRLYPGIILLDVWIDGKLGYINTDGELLIQPQYLDEGVTWEGLTSVRTEEGWTWIDWTGNPLSDERYDEVRRFNEGLAAFCEDGMWGYINSSGEVTISPRFEMGGEFHQGLAAIRDDGLFGYIDTSGEWAIEARFKSAYSFQPCGVACVSQGLYDNYLIDRSGEPITDLGIHVDGMFLEMEEDYIPFCVFPVWVPRLANACSFFVGVRDFFDFQYAHSKWGFIDFSGNVVIQPRFDYVDSFHEGLAMVSIDDRCGFIDKQGDWVIEPVFAYGHFFSEGLAPVRPVGSDYWGYINRDGECVIEPRFNDLKPFRKGRAVVGVQVPDGKPYWSTYGVIDREGNTLIPCEYMSIWPAGGGRVFKVLSKETSGYMNLNGEWVWKQEYDEEE